MNCLIITQRRALPALLALLLGGVGTLSAQISAYTFSSSAGTYTPITGGTLVAQATAVPFNSVDNAVFGPFTMPFNFRWNCAVQTQYYISSNGFITFGSTAPRPNSYGPISATTAYAGAVAAVGGDLAGTYTSTGDRTAGSAVITGVANMGPIAVGMEVTGTGIPTGTTIIAVGPGSEFTMSAAATSTVTGGFFEVFTGDIRTEVLGTCPNRTLVIQYTNFQHNAATNDAMSFQIRLSEGTDQVQVVYGSSTYLMVGSTMLQVGLRGGTNADFNNRTTTTDWSATTAGGSNTATVTWNAAVQPPNGLTYTWTSPSCPPDASVSNLTAPASVCQGATFSAGVLLSRVSGPDIPVGDATVTLTASGANSGTLGTLSNSVLLDNCTPSETLTFTGLSLPNAGATTLTATLTYPGDGNAANDVVTRSITVNVLPTTTGYTVCQGSTVPVGDGLTASGCPTVPGSFSGVLTTSTPTFNRPIENGTTGTLPPTTLSGSLRPYQAIPFVVDVTGSYTIRGCFSGSTDDGYGFVYQDDFDPGAPLANIIVGDDDAPADPFCPTAASPLMTVTLNSGVLYYLVSSTYNAITASVNYSYLITGPGTATTASVVWYTASSGGSLIGTGSPFNPVGVAGSGVPDTNTPGSTTFYAACSTSPACRTAAVFTIDPAATVNAGADQTVCAGDDVTLGGAIGGAATSATWTTAGDGTFDDATSLTAVYTPGAADIAAGTVTLTLTTNDPAGPCPAAVSSLTVTIDAPATANAGADQTVCAGDDVTLGGAIGGAATSATWTTAGDGTFDDATSLTAVYTPGAADIAAGTVTLTLTTNDPAGPCPAAVSSLTVTIDAPATANAGADQTICAGGTATMAGAIGGGATTATWSTAGDGSFSDVNSLTAVYTPGAADVAAGTVVLTLTATSGGACPAVSSSMTLTIVPYPTTGGYTVCQGSTVPVGDGLTASGCPTVPGSFSGVLTTSTPTFNRPNENGTTGTLPPTTLSGSLRPYQAIPFVVDVTGSYTIRGCFSGSTDDGYGFVYQDDFDPGAPLANIIVGDDDAPADPFCPTAASPLMTVTLNSGVLYYLVSSTYDAITASVNYTYLITGPGTATTASVAWYTASSGGSLIGTGSPFNPVGVPGSGVPDTNTPGSTTFYAQCAGGCRVPVQFEIEPLPTVTATVSAGCPADLGGGNFAYLYTFTSSTGDGADISITGETPTVVSGATATYLLAVNTAFTVDVTDAGCSNSITVNVPNFVPGGIAGTDVCEPCALNDGDGFFTFYDAGTTGYIASVQDILNGTSLAAINVCVTIEPTVLNCNGQPYLQRWWDIDATVPTTPASVRLYFTQTELDNLAAAEGITATALIPLLQFTSWTGSGSCGDPNPSTYFPLTVVGPDVNGVYYAEFTANHFSTFYLHRVNQNIAPLPITLVYFTGEVRESDNLLRWRTAGEYQSAYFEVERSFDGVNFTAIGDRVLAAGESTTARDYRLIDREPSAGNNYYRLRMVSTDGRFEYSNVVVLYRKATQFGITNAIPNPTNGRTTVFFTDNTVGEVSYVLYDVLGRALEVGKVGTVAGVNTLELDLNDKPAAAYVLSMMKDGQVVSYRIVKN